MRCLRSGNRTVVPNMDLMLVSTLVQRGICSYLSYDTQRAGMGTSRKIIVFNLKHKVVATALNMREVE